MAEASDTFRDRHNGALKSSAQSVMSDVATLRQDITRLAQALSDAAQGSVLGARSQLSGLTNTLRENATTQTQRVGEHVRARPMAAIGIALGAGLLLGLALRGKGSSHL